MKAPIMELVDFMEKTRDLRMRERRYHFDDIGEYGEIILHNAEIDHWHALIEDALGPPMKKAGEPVGEALVELTRECGELFDHQTLYYMEAPGQRMFAMLWPWRHEPYTTLKLFFFRTPTSH